MNIIGKKFELISAQLQALL